MANSIDMLDLNVGRRAVLYRLIVVCKREVVGVSSHC